MRASAAVQLLCMDPLVGTVGLLAEASWLPALRELQASWSSGSLPGAALSAVLETAVVLAWVHCHDREGMVHSTVSDITVFVLFGIVYRL